MLHFFDKMSLKSFKVINLMLNKKLYVSFLLSSLIHVISIFGQSTDYISLNAKEKKQIEELLKEEEKANKKLAEAENLFNSMTTVADEKEQQKLFDNALKKQIEGYDIKIKFKRSIYEIYSTKVYEFWNKFTGQPDEAEYAASLSAEARDKYVEFLSCMENIEKTNDLPIKKSYYEKATRYLNSALLLIQQSFEIYTRIPLHPTHEQRLKNLKLMDSLMNVNKRK